METYITDAGLKHLEGLTHLQGLNLSGTPGITDAGIKHLGALQQLKSLDLGGTQITDAGLEHLKGLTELPAIVAQQPKGDRCRHLRSCYKNPLETQGHLG